MAARHAQIQQKYGTGQAHAAGPLDTLLALYAKARSCAQEADVENVLRCLRLLRDSLDFSQSPEIAYGLSQIYTYCESAAREKRCGQVERILGELEIYWQRASAA